MQCCYNTAQRLMLGPPGGGSLDFADSRSNVLKHFLEDVLPYFTCCLCSQQCNRYYEKRPSIDSSELATTRVLVAAEGIHILQLWMEPLTRLIQSESLFTLLQVKTLSLNSHLSIRRRSGCCKASVLFLSL